MILTNRKPWMILNNRKPASQNIKHFITYIRGQDNLINNQNLPGKYFGQKLKLYVGSLANTSNQPVIPAMMIELISVEH